MNTNFFNGVLKEFDDQTSIEKTIFDQTFRNKQWNNISPKYAAIPAKILLC